MTALWTIAALWIALVAGLLWLSLRSFGNTAAGWRYFAVQFLSTAIATPVGWAVLILPCLLHLWTGPVVASIKPLPNRNLVDRWLPYAGYVNLLALVPVRLLCGPSWWLVAAAVVCVATIALNLFAFNPEDGVSAIWARIWSGDSPPQLEPYKPTPAWAEGIPIAEWLWASWRSYCWSALRNSADQLKYTFAWPAGTNVSGTWWRGRKYVIGWRPENGFNVPVLDL